MRSPSGFDVRVHAPVVALDAAFQQVAQREESGGLAGLSWSVQDEILLLPDQFQDLDQMAG